ncbi:RHS domain-containing protein [Rodentibacter pneumotropicus]|uniref:RHS domain-containing protein n=1 Tax=Rodentibacter pneumotropicus TaxID=758 RepID=UPI003B516999
MSRWRNVLPTDRQGNRIEHEINYFHCDQIGIPREVMDSEGKLIWRGRYDAWGQN